MRAAEAPEGHNISWRMAGPGGGGWIQSMAFDPQQRDTFYVGCDVGGFYVSTNAGRSYEIRNRGLHDYFVEAIAVHPKDSRIILLGMQGGIQRSTDGGMSWQAIRAGFPAPDGHRYTAPIGAVCFDPAKPNVAYAGIGRPRFDKEGAGAIYRSDDTGATWRRVDGGQLPAKAIVSDLKLQPGDSRVILAATSVGVFRSDDEGKTWRASSEGLPHRYTEELAFAPSSPATVYVTLRCTATAGQKWNGGVFVSENGGASWSDATGEGVPRKVGKGSESRHLSTNPKEIAVDPRNANVVYVGCRDWVSAGVYKTTDGGKHWTRAAYRTQAESNIDYGWITMWGPAVESMALCPTAPDRVAFGTSGHVFLTDDAGKSWQQRYTQTSAKEPFAGAGLEVTCAWRVSADPVKANRLYFCFMDIGLLISDDQGKTFRRSAQGMKTGGNCFGVVVDPQAPDTLWAATGWWNHNAGDVCRSDDGGKSWSQVGHPGSGLPDGQVLEMALDLKSPVGQRRLVATCNGHGLYETRDGGKTWQAMRGNLSEDDVKQPRGLLLDPRDSGRLIAALGGKLFETRDCAKTWQALQSAEVFGDIKQLVADPENLGTLYIAARERYDHKARKTYPGGVYRSEDGGKTWRQLLADRFVHSVAVNPANPRILYATTTDHPFHDDCVSAGLLRSADGGRTWQKENTGLSLLNIKVVSVNPLRPEEIYIGTSGNAMFVGKDAGVKVK